MIAGSILSTSIDAFPVLISIDGVISDAVPAMVAALLGAGAGRGGGGELAAGAEAASISPRAPITAPTSCCRRADCWAWSVADLRSSCDFSCLAIVACLSLQATRDATARAAIKAAFIISARSEFTQ